jgi:hypothetical protein
MKKQIDGIAIGVIIFGVIASSIIIYVGKQKVPQPLPEPTKVVDAPVQAPKVDFPVASDTGTQGAGSAGGPGAGTSMSSPMGASGGPMLPPGVR